MQAPNTGGYLFLAANDFDNTANNAGAFDVRIQDTTPDGTADDVVIEAEDMFLSAGYSIEPGQGRIFIADTTNNPKGYAIFRFPVEPEPTRSKCNSLTEGLVSQMWSST